MHRGHHLPNLPTHRHPNRLLHRLQTQRPQDLRQRRPAPVLLRLQQHRQLHLLPVRLPPQPQPRLLLPLRQLPPARLFGFPGRIHVHPRRPNRRRPDQIHGR
ncbi:hypothetical protein LINGRAHAP2_LOCUS25493 [Linum grandiflorum]